MTDRTRRATHLRPLSAQHWGEIERELKATLVELSDLSRIGKQLPGSVVGPLFQPLLEQLDDLVELWRELGDIFAEPARVTGMVTASSSELEKQLSMLRAELAVGAER
jgi:DNA-binding ferritin-like protein